MTLRSKVAKRLFKTDMVDGFERRITVEFWNRSKNYPYKPHAGVDYGADTGEELIAYDDYEVIGVNTGHGDYGQHVFLYFPKINHTGLYAHNSKNLVKHGDKGKRGCVIAIAGNTGKSSGPHLHFGLGKGKITSTHKGNREGDIWVDFETFDYDNNLVLEPIKTVAQEVLNGSWGNGQERKDKLTKAGYDYNVVQAEVNTLVRANNNKPVSDNEPVVKPFKPYSFTIKKGAYLYDVNGNRYAKPTTRSHKVTILEENKNLKQGRFKADWLVGVKDAWVKLS